MAPYSTDLAQKKAVERLDGETEVYSQTEATNEEPYKIVWRNIAVLSFIHIFGIYGLYLVFTAAKFYTLVFLLVTFEMSVVGVTAGAHRFWAHKSYKANTPLKLILMSFHILAHAFSVIEWARDHRMHHKYEGTNADPYSIHKGFFFAHFGWLLVRKHEDVKTKGKGIDLSDLYNDSLVSFEHRHHLKLLLVISFILPTLVPMIFWNETLMTAFSINMLRICFAIHSIACINSWSHYWGYKPYNKTISATQSAVLGLIAGGEGWHNYHHTFPWDYRGSEFGTFNFSLYFINFFAKLGWAYDLKTVSEDMIMRTMQKTGDGSKYTWKFGEKYKSFEDYQRTVITDKRID